MQKVRRHLHNLEETIYKIVNKEERLANKREALEIKLEELEEKREALEEECEYLTQYIRCPCPETERNWRACYIHSPWWLQRVRATLTHLSFKLEDKVPYYARRFAYCLLLRPLITVIRILVPLLFVGAGFFFLFSGKIATSIQCFIVGALIIGCYKVLVSALRDRSF